MEREKSPGSEAFFFFPQYFNLGRCPPASLMLASLCPEVIFQPIAQIIKLSHSVKTPEPDVTRASSSDLQGPRLSD